MNENGNTARIQAVLWIVLGAMMVLFFFLPLFSSALYELNGIETIDFVRDMDTDKIKRYDKLTGILMIGVPVLGVLIGFLAVVFGIAGLSKGSLGRGLGMSVLAGLNLLLGVVCVVKLDGQASGFFGALFPKAATGFYVLLFLHLALAGVGPLLAMMRRN